MWRLNEKSDEGNERREGRRERERELFVKAMFVHTNELFEFAKKSEARQEKKFPAIFQIPTGR
jgi:uncharacterized protein YkuJ